MKELKYLDLNINMITLTSKVIIVQVIEPISGILIENPHLASMNKMLFNIIWEIL